MQYSPDEVDFINSIKLSIYRALWAEIVPTMRAIVLMWSPGDEKAWLYFYHDGYIEHVKIREHYASIMTEVDADYWGRDVWCDYQVIRCDYPQTIQTTPGILVYLRKEPFLDP